MKRIVHFLIWGAFAVFVVQHWTEVQELLATAWQQVLVTWGQAQPYSQSYWDNVARNWDVVYEVVPAVWTWTVRLFFNIAVVLLWILGLLVLAALLVMLDKLPAYIKAKTREAESIAELNAGHDVINDSRHNMKMRLRRAEVDAAEQKARYYAIRSSMLEREIQEDAS